MEVDNKYKQIAALFEMKEEQLREILKEFEELGRFVLDESEAPAPTKATATATAYEKAEAETIDDKAEEHRRIG